MFRIDTDGLHGQVFAFMSTVPSGNEGVAIVKRDSMPETYAYSTHRVGRTADGRLVTWSGHYDLTLEDARADLGERA